MRVASVSIIILLSTNALAQQAGTNKALSFSAGRITFGTGDFSGYCVDVGYTNQLNKKSLKHFFLGAELSFENGNEQPKVINPTLFEFAHQLYYSTTNIVLIPNVTYYPLMKTFLRGIHISGGVSIGYTNQNREFQASYRYDSVTQMSVRRSYLEYINQVIFGYRVSVTYDHRVTRHFFAGIRVDFENYTNLGDINTLLAATVGYAF